MRRVPLRSILLAFALCAPHCDTPRNGDRARIVHASSTSPPASPRADPTDGVRIVEAPSQGDPAEWIRRVREDAEARGRHVVVFVTADWCPPCQAFHLAIEAHLLDASLPTLTLLEFDHDLDGDRLRAAGYACRALPCFTAPGRDGRATKLHVEGVESVDAISRALQRLSTPQS
jgi:thiol-disulfide isomerase/thioredoxin